MNYPDDFIGKVIHGDCRSITPMIPDKAIDAIITDPVWPNSLPELKGSADPFNLLLTAAADWPRLTDRVIIILGCDSDPRFLQAIPRELPFVRYCWLRRIPPSYKGPILNSADIAFVFGRRFLVNHTRVMPGDYQLTPDETFSVSQHYRSQGNVHPCPRSINHMSWLIQRYTEPGSLILDPFCGQGTTLKAATLIGRRSIGIEIDEAYIEAGTAAQADQWGPLGGAGGYCPLP
jgi:hypothetical protein